MPDALLIHMEPKGTPWLCDSLSEMLTPSRYGLSLDTERSNGHLIGRDLDSVELTPNRSHRPIQSAPRSLSLMPLNITRTTAPHQIIYEDIRARTRALAGTPPPNDYQGHLLVDIRLSYGDISISDIGRYAAKVCAHDQLTNATLYSFQIQSAFTPTIATGVASRTVIGLAW